MHQTTFTNRIASINIYIIILGKPHHINSYISLIVFYSFSRWCDAALLYREIKMCHSSITSHGIYFINNNIFRSVIVKQLHDYWV